MLGSGEKVKGAVGLMVLAEKEDAMLSGRSLVKDAVECTSDCL